ncbi:hypothetical protein AeMF1_012750 [Aphanomyces euteiches]|nr:hypothetical protein AeMF1_012750 [Aphanomyces euteiches]
MNSVVPHVDDLKRTQDTKALTGVSSNTRQQWLEQIVGIAAVAISTAMSIAYMNILHSYVQNDYFWTHFNTSGTQSFLADVFNAQLWNTSKDLPLFSIDVAIEKDYSTPDTTITIIPTDSRRIIMEQLSNLPYAIVGLRSQTPDQTMRLLICFCWLDFDRQWEVAHTVNRQKRCRDRYIDNGAVYMEATLRNTDWASYYQRWGSLFDIAYGSAIRESPGGAAWLSRTTSALAITSLEAELEFWTVTHDIKRYVVAWHNHQESGFDNSIVLEHAVRSFVVPLNHAQFQRRSGLWTSVIATIGVFNDLNYASSMNASLVRNASNSFTKLAAAKNPEMWSGDYPDTIWSIVLHDKIRPLAAIDLIYVLPPASLTNAISAARTALVRALQTDDALHAQYKTTPAMVFDMVPKTWLIDGVQYFGGDPLCLRGTPLSYVQQSFGFDNACSSPQPPLTLEGDVKSIVVAMWLHSLSWNSTSYFANRLSIICQLNQVHIGECIRRLPRLYAFFETWTLRAAQPHVGPSMLADILSLNVSLMQFVATTNNQTMLQQPIVDLNDPDWSFYGWLHLVDWVQGLREVVAFDGDLHSVVLISKQYTPLAYVADPLATPTRFSTFIWFAMGYICVLGMSVTLASLFVFGVATRGSFRGRNLWFASPIVGSVWIGRPLVMLRGIVAISVLTSVPMELVRVRGFTRIDVVRRSLFDVLLCSGETLWLTYALNDMLSIINPTFVVEVAFPFAPSASFSRTCESSNMDARMTCNSGVIKLGSPDRFYLLFAIHFVCEAVAYALAGGRNLERQGFSKSVPVVIPTMAAHLFEREEANGMYFDAVSSFLSGFIPFHAFGYDSIFSVVLWLNFHLGNKSRWHVFRVPQLRLAPTQLPISGPSIAQLNSTSELPGINRVRLKLRAFAAVVFLIVSIASSASFFYLSREQLANDFLWAGFNSTGMQAFLIDVFNSKLQTRYGNFEIALNETNIAQSYSSTVASLLSSTLEYNTWTPHDGWLSSAMDSHTILLGGFQPHVGMASSVERQRRCQRRMPTNGAVYIESLVRNVPWLLFSSCWGDAFYVAIAATLRQSNRGREWLDRSIARTTTVADEVAFWNDYAIDCYVVQWQNYKTTGVKESFVVENALGRQYPLTLKATTGAFRFGRETSRKMYWGWASDLVAAYSMNASLIRTSAAFLFANTSIETLVLLNGTMSAPLDAGLALVRHVLGPFGNVDMLHVPVPRSLLDFVAFFRQEDTAVLLHNATAQTTIVVSATFQPFPASWATTYTYALGGSILCPAAAKLAMSAGLKAFVSRQSSCIGNFGESTYVSRQVSALAIIANGHLEECAACPTIQNVCGNTTMPTKACLNNLLPVHAWVRASMPRDLLHHLFVRGQTVAEDIRMLRVSIAQYVQKDQEAMQLVQAMLLDPSDPYFSLFSWYFLLDWVDGLREVISFQGDVGSMTVVSSYLPPMSSSPMALEIHTNFVSYCQLCIQYTTCVLFLVTIFALAYACLSGGHIEGYNMLEINRVAGIVWVGRPLLCIRSAVAILMLSTSTLTLETSGIFTRLATPERSAKENFSTFLAGNETCWLVIVVTDLAIFITKDHTTKYSLYSSLVTTSITAILSLVSPVQPSVSVVRACDAVQFDLQLTCQAGVVQIGSNQRVGDLVFTTLGVLLACFLWEKWRHPNFELPTHKLSLWLPAGAFYLYEKQPWIIHDTLYLDRVSAFMCGLLAVTHKASIYLLDIKTWRAYTIAIDPKFDARRLSTSSFDNARLADAIPMIE